MEPEKLIETLAVAECLKDATRHCYTSRGRRESVAEHSWRITLMAYLVSDEFPEADLEKLMKMCLIHDLGEAFTGDIPTFEKSEKDEEKEAIKDEKEYQVGIDALTIAVNPENPVTGVLDDLSTEQIVSLFSGKYATWKDLDPSLPDEKVVVITRDINGGAHEVFQKNIMGDTEISSEAIQASSMGELVQDIIDNKYAIGYASFGVANQNAGKVVTLKVNGVEPTKENIIDGSYIIQRPLLIVGSGDPTDVQQAFLDVILGETGQKTVEDMGFIPMK